MLVIHLVKLALRQRVPDVWHLDEDERFLVAQRLQTADEVVPVVNVAEDVSGDDDVLLRKVSGRALIEWHTHGLDSTEFGIFRKVGCRVNSQDVVSPVHHSLQQQAVVAADFEDGLSVRRFFGDVVENQLEVVLHHLGRAGDVAVVRIQHLRVNHDGKLCQRALGTE